MRAKVNRPLPDTALTRILDALEIELIDASDDEILAAAKELGMDPTRKDSAAFSGVMYPEKPQLSDFFDLDAGAKLPPPDEK
jgi:hypothetical protein